MTDKEFFREEFKESYEHYRHLEKQRSGHLAFFFTILSGFFGFLGYLFKDVSSVINWTIFISGMTIVFLQILDTVILAAIRRIGDALKQHYESMQYLRSQLTSDKTIEKKWDAFVKKPHVSVQFVTELTLHFFAIFFFVTASVVVIYALNKSTILCWQGFVMLSLSFILFLAHVTICVLLRKKKI
jgi:hypothetical protein